MKAVLLVSGGAAVTPFTTPDAAAREGLAAGNTMTAIRAHLLARGHAVFTAPARIGPGSVESDDGWQGFADVPLVLPGEMTMNAAGRIEDAGAALARLVGHLAESEGVDELDIVGHSMGGLFSRAAIAGLGAGAPRIRRLVTLGTPWTGSLLGDFATGDIRLGDAHGDPSTEAILEQARDYARSTSQGAAEEATRRYLAGDDGWNARQRGVLDAVPVTIVSGHYFDAHSEPSILWPHDGLVQRQSASASDVPEDVVPHRTTHELADVHSIFFADAFELPWARALTWDPDVFAIIDEALASADRPGASATE